MRFLELSLPAFGPFTDVRLDLSGGDRGLHVVYGPNEAGKSSTMRALRAFLFGFPERTTDDFVHRPRDLRVGARILREDGTELRLVRRKGRKATLLDEAGEAVDDAMLERELGGLDEELYTSLFGLGHEELVRGGERMLEGGGELGAVLFAASLGARGLQDVLRELDGEADALFRRRGQKQEVNAALADHKRAVQRARDTAVRWEDWRDRRDTLEEHRERVRELGERLREAREAEKRLERLRNALPRARRLRELEARRAELGEVPRLPEGFPERRRKVAEDLPAARDGVRALEERIGRIDRDLERLEVPEELLAQSETVDALHRRVEQYVAARQELGELEVQRDHQREEVRRALEAARPGLPVEQAGTAALDEARARTYRTLCEGEKRRAEEHARLERELERIGRELAAGERERERLGEVPDPSRLRETVQETAAELEETSARKRAELEAAEDELQRLLAELPGWQGGLEELERAPVPLRETVDEHAQRQDELAKRVAKQGERLDELRGELRRTEAELDALRRTGDVPSEAQLEDARRRREAGWELVRRAWLEGGEDPVAVKAFCEAFGAGSLAEAYAASVERADEAADRLRREADRVARRASLEAQRNRAAGEVEALEASAENAEGELDAARVAWRALWTFLAGEPEGPGAQRRWLDQRARILERGGRLRALRLEEEQLERRVRAARDGLVRALAEAGDGDAGDEPDLQGLRRRAAARAEALQQARNRHDELERDRKRLEREAEEHRAAQAHLEAEAEGDAAERSAAREALGLPPDGPPDAFAAAIEAAVGLDGALRELRQHEHEIHRRQALRDRFEQEAGELVAKCAPDLAESSPEEAVGALHRRVQKAGQDARRRDTLREERPEVAERLEKARSRVRELGDEEGRLVELAGCEGPGELEAVERRWREAGEVDGERHRLLELLRDDAAGQPLEGFLAGLDAEEGEDALAARAEEAAAEVRRLEEDRGALQRSIGTGEKELEDMEREGGAAEAAAEAQACLARIRVPAERWARLRLARAVLAREIARFGRERQDPVLRRAGALFAQLTEGVFAGLAPGVDTSDRPVLEAVRAGDAGERVPVAGLSDGTRDQLYLALRLASLERHLELHPPLPLVVDDLLIHFDDRRAAAALEVLAGLSDHTQVIFFTHHGHLRDLARRVVDPDVLFEGELRGRAGSAQRSTG